MKTTIIDILNIIARGEQPPNKIVFKNEVYEYFEGDGDYRNNNYDALFDYHEITDILNDEVEILETTITLQTNVNNCKQDKIEKLDILKQNGKTYLESYCYNYPPLEKLPLSNEETVFVSKINEIINRLNGE